MVKKVLPFLSKYIPEDIFVKGLSKVNPKFGTFIQKALSNGKSTDEIKEFIDGKINAFESESTSAQPSRNIIQQYSPELHEFIEQEIQAGRSPLEAGALASLDRKGKDFKKIIRKIEEDHKSPFSSILETVYGGKQTARPERQAESPEQANQQAPGKGKEALMAILQKLQQSRGGQ